MRSLGRGPIQYDGCPCKKGTFVHRHAQREEDVRTKGEDTSQGESPEQIPSRDIADTLVSGFQAPELRDNEFLLFKPLHS